MKAKTVHLKEQENTVIYRKKDRFAAWPFNVGVYKYPGDEVVVGFQSKYCLYETPYQVGHGYYWPEKSPQFIHARSYDGGMTWKEEDCRCLTEMDDLAWRCKYEKQSIKKPEKAVDFKDPDLMIFQSIVSWESGGPGYYLMSSDRGKTFDGPFLMPWCRYDYVWGRPDYVIREDGACILFTTVYNGSESVAKPATFISKNGGLSWMLFSIISPESPENMQIMPSGVILDSGEIVAAVRCQKNPLTNWSECHASIDNGRTWQFRSRINDMGVPCHLLLLDDGRILATYGYRDYPFGIRASISEDNGKTWGPEIVLRDDGGSWDLGYPKSVQLDDGDILSSYYFNDKDDSIQQDGGVRYIACTRWKFGNFC